MGMDSSMDRLLSSVILSVMRESAGLEKEGIKKP